MKLRSLFGAILLFFAFSFIAYAAPSENFAWFTYEIDILADPASLGVGAIMVDSPTGDCLILHARPNWALARCNDQGCARERVFNQTGGKSSPWLLRDAGGIAVAYNNTTEQRIDLARPGEPEWSAAAWDVPAPCQSIVSLRQRDENFSGLLCKDAGNDFWHAWQTQSGWDIEEWPVWAHNQSFGYDANGLPRTAQVIETDDLSYDVAHWWQDTDGAWHSEIVFSTSHPVFPLGFSMFAVSGNVTHIFLHRNGDTGDSLWHLSGEPGGPWEIDEKNAGESYGWDFFTHVAVGPAGQVGYTYHGFSHVYDDGGDWPEYWSRYAELWLGDYFNLRSAGGDDSPMWIPHYDGYLAIDETGMARVLIEDQYFGDSLAPNLVYRHGAEGEEFPLASALYFFADTGFSIVAQPVENGLEPYLFSPFARFPSFGTWTEYFRLYGLTDLGWSEFKTWEMWPSSSNYPIDAAATDDGLHFTYGYNGSAYFLVTYKNSLATFEEIQPAFYWSYLNRGTSLFGRADQLLLAFSDDQGVLRFARRPAGGSLSDVQNVDEQAHETAVTSCPDGTARIAFRDENDAVLLATENGGFSVETVDDVTGCTGELGITCDQDGNSHIVFTAGDDLYYTTNTPDAWQTELLSEGLSLGAVSPDAVGKPWVLARQPATTAVLLLNRTGDEWTQETMADETTETYTALWSRGDDLIACSVPETSIVCRSTAPFVPGEPPADDDTVDDDTIDDDTIDDDTIDDDIIDDDTIDDDSIDDDIIDDDTIDDDSIDDDIIDDDTIDDDTTDDDTTDDDMIDDDMTDDDMIDDDSTDDDSIDDDTSDDDDDNDNNDGCGR